jgi:hypothetical protein
MVEMQYDWLDLENSLYKVLSDMDDSWGYKAQTIKKRIEQDFEFCPKMSEDTLVSLLAVWVGSISNSVSGLKGKNIHESLTSHLIKDEITLRLKAITVVNTPEVPKEPRTVIVEDGPLSDKEEAAILRILAMVEEKGKECASASWGEGYNRTFNYYQEKAEESIKQGTKTNEAWLNAHAQQWASRRSSKLLANLSEGVVEESIDKLLAPVIAYRDKIFNDIYTEILNRSTELQEQSKGTLIPELNGLIEALNVIQSLQNSYNTETTSNNSTDI